MKKPDKGLTNDIKFLFKTIWAPFVFSASVVIIYFYDTFFNLQLSNWGIYPRTLFGLSGIFASPLIHGDIRHLINNIVPLFVLLCALFYFYRVLAYRLFIWFYLLPGILTWIIGRPSYHIGSSTIIYALASFLFVSGIFRKIPGLVSVSLLVAFLYGSMVWGILPYKILPVDIHMSWEGHASGAFTGILFSILYRYKGPQPDEISEEYFQKGVDLPEEIWNIKDEEDNPSTQSDKKIDNKLIDRFFDNWPGDPK